MNPLHLANCEELKLRFEGREAIYVEKGCLRVRVHNIGPSVEKKYVEAEVEEICTPGLERTVFHHWFGNPPIPLRWGICAGYQSRFSRNYWVSTDVAGWSLYFHQEIVHGVVEMASQFDENSDFRKGYREILRFVQQYRKNDHDITQPVFPVSTQKTYRL